MKSLRIVPFLVVIILSLAGFNVQAGSDQCQAAFEYTGTWCGSTCLAFFNKSDGEILKYYWEFGDGDVSELADPVHTFTEKGNYLVCLSIVTVNGCESTCCDTITIDTDPFLPCDLTFDVFTLESYPEQYSFVPVSDKPFASYHWDFGNGVYADEKKPVVQFESPGIRTVCLNVIDSLGDSCTFCRTMFFNGLHTPDCHLYGKVLDYSHLDGCGLLIKTENGNLLEPVYNNTDVELKAGQEIRFSYTPVDMIGICMAGQSVQIDCIEYITKDTVNKCRASFKYEQTEDGMVIFTDHSTGDIAGWQWDFGNGEMSFEPETVFQYDQNGTYEVCLTIYTNDSCSDTYCQDIEISETETCHAGFYAEPADSLLYIINPDTAIFSYRFIDDSKYDGKITMQEWSFGDGNSSQEKKPVHTYQDSGIYKTCYTILTSEDCFSTQCQYVIVGTRNQCKAAFSYETYYPEPWISSLYPGKQVFHFKDKSVGEVVSWHWEFGDGIESYQPGEVRHQFMEDGWYEVKLTVLTADSCSSTYTEKVRVENLGADCTSWFHYDIMETYPPRYAFHPESTGEIIAVEWSFGDGEFSDERHPVHMYKKGGYYDVCLKVEGINGCTSSYCQEIWVEMLDTVNPNPCDAYIHLNTSTTLGLEDCNGAIEASLVDQNGNPKNVTSYSWNTGDTLSTIVNACPDIYYAVSLTDDSGCVTSGSFMISDFSDNVFPPHNSWRYQYHEGKYYFNINDIDKGYAEVVWSFDDGQQKTGSSVSHEFHSPGNHPVTVTIYDDMGNVLFSDTIMIKNDEATGMKPQGTPHLDIYPNPVKKEIYLNPTGLAHMTEISVYSINGKEMLQKNIEDDNHPLKIDVALLSNGIYIGKCTYADNKVEYFKFIKIK